MDRTYITFQGTNHIIEGTVDDVLRRWEQALAGGTMLRLQLADSTQVRCVNPRYVEGIGAPLGGGGTLTWAD